MDCKGNGKLHEEGWYEDESDNPECGDDGRQCDACWSAEYKYWRAIYDATPTCIYCARKHLDHVSDECAEALMATVEAGR